MLTVTDIAVSQGRQPLMRSERTTIPPGHLLGIFNLKNRYAYVYIT